MADYEKFAALATRLINKNGRLISLQMLSAEPEDPNKPWKGSGVPTVSQSVDVQAVFLPASGGGFGKDIIDEELLKRVSQIALVEPKQEGLELFTQIADGEIYKIEWAQALKPANKTVLYLIGVAR